ncbi:uncharacterized protein LOC117830473 [Tachysurus ichikawai]
MESLTASMYQKIYKSTVLAVQAPNPPSMLMAYQSELLEELSTQLDIGNPSLVVWEDQDTPQSVLRCDHTMGVAMA